MGGRPALTQALDSTCRSKAEWDMPTSAACWKMTEVGSKTGTAWTPLRKMVLSPCLKQHQINVFEITFCKRLSFDGS